ncbi:MAG TPA: biotin-dependent carboxyltransferase family protein [Devosia sp.]|nr:biotin-dependent carboxyltransferase family protein [Devosia sp.]
MTARILITRAGPLATIQDAGRFGMLAHGISASGPMDRSAYAAAGRLLGGAPAGALEVTTAGLDFRVETGKCLVGFAGGEFNARHNDRPIAWPGTLALVAGDTLSVAPGLSGNYGYLHFDQGIDVPLLMGSMATNSRTRLGGLQGRALRAGDRLRLVKAAPEILPPASLTPQGSIRVIWGLHADLFPTIRDRFVATNFTISARMDRMGVRLDDPAGLFTGSTSLSLVSDAVVPGDIQILGDGTPIVLMRDHQPTGGYPRIATIISADLDRFAQIRPGSAVAFASVSVDHAHHMLREGRT